jgi:hypothetical protein
MIPPTHQDCPHCGTPADWLDLMRAVDFAVRRFYLWKLEGAISGEQYRAIVDGCRKQLAGLAQAARVRRPIPTDTGLPARCTCWSCGAACAPGARYCPVCAAPLDTPEVRLLRYQTFLQHEVKNLEAGGRITAAQAQQLLADFPERLAELRGRLQQARR